MTELGYGGIMTKLKNIWKQKWGHQHLTSVQIIILGFLGTILAGTLLLMLPWASRSGHGSSFWDALFTAVSAVCVTGLVVQDTATYWSEFGQAVILLLIQIGGMGVMTVAVAIACVSGRKIGLMQRSTMQESIAAPQVGGIVRMTTFIIKIVFAVELTGALLMLPVFARDFGLAKGIWYAIFHSISAFCNAGFDLMGTRTQFSSLTTYADSPVINVVIILLILSGGIGFLTWEDVHRNRLKWRKYRMQTKVVLAVTAILVLGPALYFFFGEFTGVPFGKRLLYSLFQAVTPRTAGFNTIDLNDLHETGQFMVILLMLVGGSPGSTAGGMKTTTIAVLFAMTFSVFRKNQNPHLFKRRISEEAMRNAATLLVMYVTLFVGGGMIISSIEGIPLMKALFETASAVATVGLSMGATPELGLISRGILVVLMFIGRVGGLTLIFATVAEQRVDSRYPQEKITVG